MTPPLASQKMSVASSRNSPLTGWGQMGMAADQSGHSVKIYGGSWRVTGYLQARMIDLFLAATDTWTSIKEGLPVIMSLILIEGLLSVDNALAIAAMASHLEDGQRRTAMNIGYLGAYGFRILALVFASLISGNHTIMLLGALYLLWLMVKHFAEEAEEASKEAGSKHTLPRSFVSTVIMISLMDLSLSVDNVVAAVALSPDKMIYVYIGVTIGIISLRLVADVAVKLIKIFPVLEHTAFLLVGYVGVLLLLELHWHTHFDKSVKFIGIILLTGASVLWSRSPWLQKSLSPLFTVIGWPLRLISALVNGFLSMLAWPFVAAWRAVRG